MDEGNFVITRLRPEYQTVSSSRARRAIMSGDFGIAEKHMHPDVLAWHQLNMFDYHEGGVSPSARHLTRGPNRSSKK